MYPNQSQPTSADYLNQIAPQAPKKLPFQSKPKLFLLIGAAAVIVIIILVAIINIVSSSKRQPLEQLSARLTSTEAIVTGAQDKLKSSQLRSLNSNLKIYLTNTNRDIVTPMMSAGIDTTKISDSVTKKESGDAMTARLEDARLNAIYDRTYAREMAYQLDTLITLMKQIYGNSGNAQLKKFLLDTYANLEPTQKAFEDFNAANS